MCFNRGINNRIIEVDPEESENVQHFEEQILRMNNPYFGMWIFGNFQGAPNQMFYAGQDTRLHTPALNEVDKIAFKLLNQKDAKWVKYIARPIANNIRIVLGMLYYFSLIVCYFTNLIFIDLLL